MEEVGELALDVGAVAHRVLGLDREPHARRGIRHRRQEAFERENGRPRLIRRRLEVEPALVAAAVVVLRELAEGHGAHRPGAGAGAVDAPVVHADKGAVDRQSDVALDRVDALLYGAQVRSERVLRLLVIGPTMSHDVDGHAASVGAGVMPAGTSHARQGRSA